MTQCYCEENIFMFALSLQARNRARCLFFCHDVAYVVLYILVRAYPRINENRIRILLYPIAPPDQLASAAISRTPSPTLSPLAGPRCGRWSTPSYLSSTLLVVVPPSWEALFYAYLLNSTISNALMRPTWRPQRRGRRSP